MPNAKMTAIGIGACAAACAAGAIVPALVGGSVLGLGSLALALETSRESPSMWLCAIPLAALVAAGAIHTLRRKRPEACTSDGSCGCGPNKATASGQ